MSRVISTESFTFDVQIIHSLCNTVSKITLHLFVNSHFLMSLFKPRKMNFECEKHPSFYIGSRDWNPKTFGIWRHWFVTCKTNAFWPKNHVQIHVFFRSCLKNEEKWTHEWARSGRDSHFAYTRKCDNPEFGIEQDFLLGKWPFSMSDRHHQHS